MASWKQRHYHTWQGGLLLAVEPHAFDDLSGIFDKLSREEREEVLRRLEERCPTVDEEDASCRSLVEAMNECSMFGSM
ncbi:MAG: hypothetical protein R6U98_09420 [Pirellulaceae bacterium]